MSNTDNNNNITLYANSNIRGTIMRNHSSDPRFVVKDVYITRTNSSQQMTAKEEVSDGYNHTIIQIPDLSSPPANTAVWIMKLSDGEKDTSGNVHAVSRGTFLAQNNIISRLDISLYIPDMNFEGVYDVVVVMCRPEHAAVTNTRYIVTARGTIRLEPFGQWTFTWENLTADTITATEQPVPSL